MPVLTFTITVLAQAQKVMVMQGRGVVVRTLRLHGQCLAVRDRPGTGRNSRFVPVVFVMQGKSDIINYFHFNYFLFYIFS